MWSEEELRDIEPEPPPRKPRSLANPLRNELSTRARAQHHPHELTCGASVIFSPNESTHGNFTDAAYRRILARPAWSRRLVKAHTAKRQARPTGPDELIRPWHELDCANSSDALLMNIFCYPRVLASPRLPALLGIEPGLEPVFGYHPKTPRERGLEDRTEIDMQLGHLLVEAKLTEAAFESAPLRLLERYTHFHELFDRDRLHITTRGVPAYQLLRGILAAHAESTNFCLFTDARRPDLIHTWHQTVSAVRSFTLQSRLRLLTWQEITPTLPRPLQTFLADKYGIEPADRTS